MNKKLVYLLIACITCYATLALAVEPENLSIVRRGVVQYYESGAYSYDVNSIAMIARCYIKKRVTENKAKQKLAMVLDIDDTVISNFKADKMEGFCETKACINRIMHLVRDARIPAMLRLYNFAKKQGAAIFFITARDPMLRKITIEILHDSGYKNWTKLYLLPKGYAGTDIATFKTNVRKKIVAQGYDIILNMGDHYSDLKGSYADMTLKIPNPCN